MLIIPFYTKSLYGINFDKIKMVKELNTFNFNISELNLQIYKIYKNFKYWKAHLNC